MWKKVKVIQNFFQILDMRTDARTQPLDRYRIENNCERELRREREQRESAREREGGKDGVVAK